MIRLCSAGILFLAAIPDPPPARVWIAFSPGSAFSADALEDLIAQRPNVHALVVFPDPNRPGEFSEDAYATISALAEIGADVAGWDEAGMAQLREWGVDRLPAVVVERGSEIHVAYGRDARLSEVMRCSR